MSLDRFKMGTRMAAMLRAPRKLCGFSYVLFVFLLFYVLGVVSITVYDRDTLLNIGSSIEAAKRQYRNKVEEQFNTNNPRSMWQGINNITGFKGNNPKSRGSGWYTRPCAQSMRFPTSQGFYRHFQSVPLSVCGSRMLQKIHHLPIPKKNKITCLNDWRPVALTPIFSKCFEKLVRDYICSVLPASLDPLQFAYRSNHSTDDAIAFTLQTALSHLENKKPMWGCCSWIIVQHLTP